MQTLAQPGDPLAVTHEVGDADPREQPRAAHREEVHVPAPAPVAGLRVQDPAQAGKLDRHVDAAVAATHLGTRHGRSRRAHVAASSQ